MMSFLRGEADVLVATSIIESGIDIPQANTLIVERADMFGLAQLYQIRGRVGRSRERAYAYLLYPSAAALTEEATQAASARCRTTPSSAPASRSRCATSRSAAPATCSATSSPGHVAALGFELYLSMLDEAVRAAGPGQVEDEEAEPVRLDVNVDAYVPADYVPYEAAKIDVHRRIAGSREVADLAALRDELEDRFGPVPDAAAEPDLAPAGADQARPGRCARGADRQAGPDGGDADRPRRGRASSACARSCPRRATSRAASRSR